jgi:hypothetical protein
MELCEYISDCENAFNKSKYIRFYPFIGKGYKEMSPKIMVLGESNYIDPKIPVPTKEQLEEWNNNKDSSHYVIFEDYFPEIRENGTHPYQHIRCYRYTATMITGKDYNHSDYIWNYMSFYNFFQKHVGIGAKGKEYINDKLIEDSQKAYFEVIEILRPKLIIAWGRSWLYGVWVPQNECEIIDEGCYLYKYMDYPNTFIWHINHPSQGFSYDRFNKEFNKICKKPINNFV